MPDERVVRALVAQQAAARATINGNVIAALLRLWQALMGRWYDGNAVYRFASDSAAAVRSGQRMTADLTDEYLRRVLDEYDALPGRTAPVTLPDSLRGVDLADVYERPAQEFRYLRSTDVPEREAFERAQRRLETIAEADLALAMRESSRQRLASAGRVTGYRRVLHPELAKTGETCGLCIVASDRIYRRGDLLPIHDGCNCAVLPVVGSQDPGRSLNAEDLAALYKAAGDTTDGRALRRVRVRVRDHSELGPLLTDASHHHRGPDDVAA